MAAQIKIVQQLFEWGGRRLKVMAWFVVELTTAARVFAVTLAVAH